MDKENLNEKAETKSSLLSRVIKITGAMTKGGLNDLLSTTLEVSSDPEADGTSGYDGSFDTSVSAVNAAVAEDVLEIFAGTELSEEFKTKAAVLFEAAVNSRLELERTRITEELEEKYNTSIHEAIEEISEDVNTYVDYVAEKWCEDNIEAIEDAFKSRLSESLLQGMRDLFTEHNIALPEDNTENVVEGLLAAVETLEDNLNEVQSRNIELEAFIKGQIETEKFDEVSEGLVDTEIEKFKVLTVGIEYYSLNEYEEKLKIIRHQYFTKGDAPKAHSVGLINEDVIGDGQLEAEVLPTGSMKHYASAISKSVQK